MYQEIINDCYSGIYDSVCIGYLIKPFRENLSIRNCFWKIVKYNFLMHFFPYLLVLFLQYLLNINLSNFFNLINIPITIFSIFFHIIHYIDLISMICKYSLKMSNINGSIDLFSLTIITSIYQVVIYLSSTVIQYFIPERYNFIGSIINFVILAIYHSFYCFNSLWHYKQIMIGYRIDIHEKLWPYYIGYSMIATSLYLYSSHPIILICYNIYLIIIIMLPFFLNTRYPSANISYPKINMLIFMHVISYILAIVKKYLPVEYTN